MYLFYLGNMMLPVTPEKLELKIANNNKTITLINDGEVNLLKRPGLTKVTFGALLPNIKYPFAVSQAPFVFRVMRSREDAFSSFDTFLTVSLEEYTIAEDAEKYGRDVYVSITLLQYQGCVTKTITFQDSPSASDVGKTATISSQRDASTKEKAKTYTVQSGDSLWSIAQLQLGSGTRYQEIYTLNQTVIEDAAKRQGRDSSSKGHWIYAGTVLSLP